MSILQMSIAAGLLIVATAGLRALALNRLPKAVFLALWGLALLRLLVPIAIPLPSGVPSIGIPALPTAQMPAPATGNSAAADAPIHLLLPGSTPAAQPSRAALPTAIWLSGAGLLGAFFAVAYAKNCLRFRDATPVRDDFINNWLAGLQLLRPLAVVESAATDTPIAMGFVRPRIILPAGMDLGNTKLLHHVLTHEYCHTKRLDALWRVLLVAAVCIHWFNPAVWLMLWLAARDLEITCDEMVIRQLGITTKKDYANSIVGMACLRSTLASRMISGFSKNAAAERIRVIMKMKRTTFVAAIFSLVLVLVLGAGAMTLGAAKPPANGRLALGNVPPGFEFGGYHPFTMADGTTRKLPTLVPTVQWELGDYVDIRLPDGSIGRHRRLIPPEGLQVPGPGMRFDVLLEDLRLHLDGSNNRVGLTLPGEIPDLSAFFVENGMVPITDADGNIRLWVTAALFDKTDQEFAEWIVAAQSEDAFLPLTPDLIDLLLREFALRRGPLRDADVVATWHWGDVTTDYPYHNPDRTGDWPLHPGWISVPMR